MAGAAQASSTTAHDYVYNLTWVTKIKDRVRSMPLLERFSAFARKPWSEQRLAVQSKLRSAIGLSKIWRMLDAVEELRLSA